MEGPVVSSSLHRNKSALMDMFLISKCSYTDKGCHCKRADIGLKSFFSHIKALNSDMGLAVCHEKCEDLV